MLDILVLHELKKFLLSAVVTMTSEHSSLEFGQTDRYSQPWAVPQYHREKRSQPKDANNIWDNPPEATSSMKEVLAPFKDRFKRNEPWDGNFSS